MVYAGKGGLALPYIGIIAIKYQVHSAHFLDLLLLGLETKSAHGHLQLLGVNGTGAIGIEEVEGLLDFLLLLLGELLLLLATSVETTECHFCKI